MSEAIGQVIGSSSPRECPKLDITPNVLRAGGVCQRPE
jgi:hypothetical protein